MADDDDEDTKIIVDFPGVREAAEKKHNKYRRRHGVPPLKLDEKLNEEAQSYAEAVVRGERSPPEPAGGGLGRNEYQSSGEEGEAREEVVREAVREWYSHVSEYNWDSPTSSNHKALLFTQIVWSDSVSLGIGISSSGEDTVVIALYHPPGNLPSNQRFHDNVKGRVAK